MENNIKKESIFIQRNLSKRYTPILRELRSSILGGLRLTTAIEFTTEFISEEKITACLLDTPPLKEGDNFYIEDVNKLVVIEDVARTSNDNMVYYVKDNIIDDEISQKTYKESMDIIRDSEKLYGERITEVSDENQSLRKELREYKEFKSKVQSSFWYKFMRGIE